MRYVMQWLFLKEFIFIAWKICSFCCALNLDFVVFDLFAFLFCFVPFFFLKLTFYFCLTDDVSVLTGMCVCVCVCVRARARACV